MGAILEAGYDRRIFERLKTDAAAWIITSAEVGTIVQSIAPEGLQLRVS